MAEVVVIQNMETEDAILNICRYHAFSGFQIARAINRSYSHTLALLRNLEADGKIMKRRLGNTVTYLTNSKDSPQKAEQVQEQTVQAQITLRQ